MDIKEEIKSLKAHIALLEKQIADEKKQEEPVFKRVAEDEPYYYIFLCDSFIVDKAIEEFELFDDDAFALNNYFRSRERAEEVAEKIKMLLKLERLHDTFCPDYVPDFTDASKMKYYVFRNLKGTWLTSFYDVSQDAIEVYFPTREIAQKVCDILNAEKGE